MRRTTSLLLALTFAPTLALAQVNVNLPWARATPLTQKSAAIYMKLEAHAGAGVALVGASSPFAQKVEIRVPGKPQTGKARFPRLTIRAGSSLTLKPGASHLMLVGMTQGLVQGAHVPLTLEFELQGGGRFPVLINAEVVGANAKTALDHHHH